MKSITAFFNDSYVNNKNQSPIYLRVRIQGKYIKESLNIFIKPSQFDSKNGLIKKSVPNAEQLNMIIRDKISRANKIFIKYELSKVDLTRDLFKIEFENTSEGIDFLGWLKEKINERFKFDEISKNTHKYDSSLLSILIQFRENIVFSDIDEKFIRDFRRYLKSRSKHNTVVKHLTKFKVYTRIAIEEKLLSDKDYFRFEDLTEEEVEPGWLTGDQKNKVIEIYNSPTFLFNKLLETDYYISRSHSYAENQQKSFKRVLRWFLFSCETGLRISDLKNISFEDIFDNILIYQPLKTIRTKKRARLVRVPLTTLARKIIKDEKPHGYAGKIFNTFSEQVINRHLKAIFKMVEIELNNGNIHFHCSRHTFGSLLYQKTRNLVLVQK